MHSRQSILDAVRNNQPETMPLPDISWFKGDNDNLVERYSNVFKTIGGSSHVVNGFDQVKEIIRENFDVTKRVVTTMDELSDIAEQVSSTVDPHTYEDIELAVIKAHFAVAENGAVWLTDELMGQRIVPYICQHLAVIISAESIVPTLHEAYEIIGTGDYGFAGFIGGPSKTADIEQALVLGAHGPLTMNVFIIR